MLVVQQWLLNIKMGEVRFGKGAHSKRSVCKAMPEGEQSSGWNTVKVGSPKLRIGPAMRKMNI